MASRHTPYEKTNGESASYSLHVTCAREKHSYEIGMCDQECALHACALNKSNVRVCTCLKVNVKAIWLECSELENKPHLLLLSAGVITAAAFETADHDVIK